MKIQSQHAIRPGLALFLLLLLAACQSPALPATTVPQQEVAQSELDTTAVPTDTPQPIELPPASETPAPEASEAPPETAVAPTTESNTVTPEPVASATLPPSPTTVPTATPTSQPQQVSTRTVLGTGSLDEGVPTPVTPIPSPVPEFEVGDEITNVLLLGQDDNLDGTDAGRTDTMIIVSINRATQTASMISLPRDLLVYLPTRTMSRLNTAMILGGEDLLKQAILYNFGIPIHYYAKVDFDGFQEIVDLIGGVRMAVSCPLTDWRLISPELDPTNEDNWERYTLEAGMHQMDGDTALWFARSRLSTSDFDRGRRQQQLLRGMLNQGVDLGLVSQAPQLWSAFNDVVETDMDIGRILQLASLAPAVSDNGLQSLYLAGKMQAWQVPESGAAVQLPIWEGDNMMEETFRRLILPPALNRATRAPITVEVINATEYPAQALLAADNLAWYGFVPVIGPPAGAIQDRTEMTYYKDNFKGSFDWLFSWVMGRPLGEILLDTETESVYDYRVVLGQDYNPCRPAFLAPQAFLDE